MQADVGGWECCFRWMRLNESKGMLMYESKAISIGGSRGAEDV